MITNNGTGLTSLVKSGAGTWVLTGTNTYSGGTTINDGTLITGNASALGTGTTTINGGTLNLNTLSTVANIFLVKGGTLTNGTILSTQLSGSSSGVIAVTLSGTGGVTKTTTDTVALAGNNTYSGTTNVQAGTVQIDTVSTGTTAQSLGTGSTVNLGSAGTSSGILEYTGSGGTLSKNIAARGNGSDTIRNAGSGALTLSGTLEKNGTILRLQGGSRGINVTGRIVGSSANSDLAVQYGTTTLSATSTYTGPTYINSSGTLVLNIDNAIPSNSIVTIGGTYANGDGGAGTLSTGTFMNAIGGLLFSGSGGTISMTPTSRQTSTAQLSGTGAINLTGGPATLDLTGMAASAGLYKLISGSSLTGTFGTVTGLNSNYLLRYGTVNANEIDAQRKADQATTFTMTTGGVTRALVGTSVGVSGTITNSTPTGGSNLAVSLSSGGVLSVSNLLSGPNSVAPQASTSVSGSIAAGSTVGTRTWSVINTDANAITTTSTASGSLQVVDQRVFTTSTSTLALGYVHQGATISGPTVGVTSTGLNATTANGTLGSFTGGPSGFSLGLTSGSAQFYGATASQTATYSIAGTASTLGSLNGTYTSAVTAEFGSIPNVTVAVTGQVYSGQATWNTNGSGNWGTIAGAGVNAFGLNWGANQGSPGLDASYTNTDTATFGSSLTSGTAVIRTSGANISLKAITFNNANASYTILQSGGSNPIGLVGSGTTASAINAVAGSHTINSNLSLGSALVVDVNAGASLTVNNAISGTSSDYSLTKAGVGTLYLNGDSSYLGDTIVEAGTLRGVGSVAGLMTVRNGAEFAVGQEAAFGVFEVGALTLEAGSRTSLLISGTMAGTDYDQIASAGGALSYGGILDLTLSGSYALGTSFSLFEGFATEFGSLAGVSLTATDSPYSGLTFTKSVFGTDVVWWTNPNTNGQSLKFTEATGTLVVVPEPSTIVIASIGVALAGLWRVRRRKALQPQA